MMKTPAEIPKPSVTVTEASSTFGGGTSPQSGPTNQTVENEKMNRAQLKKLWNRSKKDRKFRRLLHAMLVALVWEASEPDDQLNACALADYILKNAGTAGRRDLKRRLTDAGWEL